MAGIYIGRRCHYLDCDEASFSAAAKQVSIFSAFVTSLEALPIGLLTLREESIVESINRILGFVLFNANQFVDVLLIVVRCGILFGIQFLVASIGIRLSFSLNCSPRSSPRMQRK